MSDTYSFPNIHFKEGIVGPAPQFKPWRNTIGVAASFRRRPTQVVSIFNLQQKLAYFGDDDSPGSLFLNQAMSQGATNFVVSPASQKGTFADITYIFSASTNPTENLAETTFSGTAGIGVDIEYIGDAIDVNVVGSKVTSPVKSGTSLFPSVTNYSGRGQIVSEVIRFVPSGSGDVGSAVTGTIYSGSGHRLVTFDKSTYDLQSLAHIRAGYNLYYSGSSASGTVAIRSDVIDHSPTEWAIVCSGSFDDSGAVYMVVREPVSGRYVFANTIETVEGFNFSSEYKPKIASTNKNVHSYTVVTQNSVNVNIPIRYWTTGTTPGSISQVNTGIDVSFSPYRLNRLFLRNSSRWVIPFAKGSVSIGNYNGGPRIPVGSTAIDIINMIRAAVSNNQVFASLLTVNKVLDTEYPPSISFKSRVVGEVGNRIALRVNRTALNPSENDVILSASNPAVTGFSSSFHTMLNGYDPEQSASLLLWSSVGIGEPLIKIQSLLAGDVGNSISVSLASTNDGECVIIVTDNDSAKFLNKPYREVFTLNFNEVENGTGLFLATANSSLIRAYFLPEVHGTNNEYVRRQAVRRLAPAIANRLGVTEPTDATIKINQGPSYINNIYLSGATTAYPNTPSALLDFLHNAVKELEYQDVAIIACPDALVGVPETQFILDELVEQAERSTVNNGLRIAVLGTTVDYPVESLEQASASIDSERVVLIHSHCRLATKSSRQFSSAIGLYAGYIAVNEPHIHPQASGLLGPVINVASSSSPNSPLYLDLVTRSRVEVLFYDTAFEYFHFLNGKTTSLTPTKQFIAIRREQDRIQHEIFRALLPLRSQIINENLYDRVRTSCDTILTAAKAQGRIRSFAPTICGPQNNTPEDVIRRIVNFTIRFEPLLPADFLRGTVIREFMVTQNLTLQTS